MHSLNKKSRKFSPTQAIGNIHPNLPFIVLGVVGSIASFLLTRLQETKGQPTRETIREGNTQEHIKTTAHDDGWDPTKHEAELLQTLN